MILVGIGNPFFTNLSSTPIRQTLPRGHLRGERGMLRILYYTIPILAPFRI